MVKFLSLFESRAQLMVWSTVQIPAFVLSHILLYVGQFMSSGSRQQILGTRVIANIRVKRAATLFHFNHIPHTQCFCNYTACCSCNYSQITPMWLAILIITFNRMCMLFLTSKSSSLMTIIENGQFSQEPFNLKQKVPRYRFPCVEKLFLHEVTYRS